VISAEQTYASANCGFFSDLINLCRNGGDCAGVGIPNYPTNAPEFVGGDLGRTSPYPKSGYDRQFVPVNSPPTIDTTRCDDLSEVDYCYHSTPTNQGLSGVRGFMGSATGAIYITQDGQPVACPADSTSLFLE